MAKLIFYSFAVVSSSLLDSLTIHPMPTCFHLGMEEWVDSYFYSIDENSPSRVSLLTKISGRELLCSTSDLSLLHLPHSSHTHKCPPLQLTLKSSSHRPRNSVSRLSVRRSWKPFPSLMFQRIPILLPNGL